MSVSCWDTFGRIQAASPEPSSASAVENELANEGVRMSKTMAEVLAEHRYDNGHRSLHQHCTCGWFGKVLGDDFTAHQADALSAAGFGLVADAKAPEVRYSTLTNGETELDEVVATNATVHLEAMNDNHWWLLVESGGESVHVNFYTKRAKIRGHAETDS